jgi:hypothetical protein
MRQFDSGQYSQGQHVINHIRLGEPIRDDGIVEASTVPTAINPYANKGFLDGSDAGNNLSWPCKHNIFTEPLEHTPL